MQSRIMIDQAVRVRESSILVLIFFTKPTTFGRALTYTLHMWTAEFESYWEDPRLTIEPATLAKDEWFSHLANDASR